MNIINSSTQSIDAQYKTPLYKIVHLKLIQTVSIILIILLIQACGVGSNKKKETDISGVKIFNISEKERSCSEAASADRSSLSYIIQNNNKITVDALGEVIEGVIVDSKVYLNWQTFSENTVKKYDGTLIFAEAQIGARSVKFLIGDVNWVEKENDEVRCSGIDQWIEQVQSRFCSSSTSISPTFTTIKIPTDDTPRIAFRIHKSTSTIDLASTLTTPDNKTVTASQSAYACSLFGNIESTNSYTNNYFCNTARPGLYSLLIKTHTDSDASLTVETGAGNPVEGLNTEVTKFELPVNIGCGQRFNIRVIK